MDPADFDTALLDPTRLSIVALLAGVEWAEFRWVRESAGVSPSALSKQVSTLEARGYVEVEKGYVGKRPRTWISLNQAGRDALEGHMAAMRRVVEESQRAGRVVEESQRAAERRDA
ncbi:MULTISPECIES: transcriptional regulator [unclassified Streptomyces]|uniref:winged helix-turn-helix domain-containing protein n=1 Tax=unclassified Streptomyces TaxID=2593676 RepID=UPI002DD8D2C5|nr:MULTISPECIES: transcriptional regulator [unclassified Streptomyces]WSA93235.1 transcriptional regulator [Streptomyces sp. NBC_01795]WSB77605.1 transcriptional regulator [Streptomyces sp. NBC_01775]WSS14127.1 transcriptional regulator [Streptomyces sp. NBC_01186]WSS42949.1 transcriptional regulator [Streptomyces sp. NBC_01187]